MATDVGAFGSFRVASDRCELSFGRPGLCGAGRAAEGLGAGTCTTAGYATCVGKVARQDLGMEAVCSKGSWAAVLRWRTVRPDPRGLS